ncbi:MAG: GHKL domain-containing protein [Clostridia bacterium]|nr:GHKL domain-containing protein [Clostridia bacterium]
MIQSLRRRFIITAMLAVFLVVGAIIASINVSNYHSTFTEADRVLNLIADNEGEFPKEENAFKKDPPPRKEKSPTPSDVELPNKKPDKNGHHNAIKVSPEDVFTTRYFTVTLDLQANVLSVNTEKISAITTEQATQMASSLFAKQKSRGFYNTYRYCAVSFKESTQYIFLDRTNELNAYYVFMWTSIAISLGGLLLVFILVLFFSGLAIKPIAESYEKQKQFITDASHELKTPLTIVDANTEVLEMMNGENEWTKSIRNQITRLSSLTEELVTLSRLEEKQGYIPISDFSLSDAVTETAEPFEAVAQSQNKQLILLVEDALSYHGDEASLRRLIGILLDNAMKYSAPQSNITLQLKANGKRRIITVENKVEQPLGENPERWFERFYRPDASRSSLTGGYGIGLATAKAIVTAHKGKITAKVLDKTSVQITVVL